MTNKITKTNEITNYFWNYRRHLELLLVIFCLAFASILVTLLLFKLLPKLNQFAHSCNVDIAMKIGHSSIPIHHNFHFWFVSCVTSSVVFYICLMIANNWVRYKNGISSVEDKTKTPQIVIINQIATSAIIFAIDIAMWFLKDAYWDITIKINNNWVRYKNRIASVEDKAKTPQLIIIKQIATSAIMFAIAIAMGFLKDACWAITIKINSYFTYKQAGIYSILMNLTALFSCAVFLQFHNFLMARSIFKPIGIKKYTNSEKSQRKLNTVIERITAFIIKLMTNTDVKKSNIDMKKFLQYIGILLLASTIMGIPAFLARTVSAVLMRELVGKLKFLTMNWGFNLNGKFVQLINNQNAMLFICVFDCIWLIFFTYLIHRFSIWLYEKSCVSNERKEEYRLQSKEKNDWSDKGKKIFAENLKKYCPKQKLKSEFKLIFICKIFFPSVIMAIFFHMITQIQKSILDYSHTEIASLAILGALLVVTLTLCLISSLYLNGTFSSLNGEIILKTYELPEGLDKEIKNIPCQKKQDCCNESCLCSCCSSKLNELADKNDDVKKIYQSILTEINNGNGLGKKVSARIAEDGSIVIYEMGEMGKSEGRCPCSGSAGKLFHPGDDAKLSFYLEHVVLSDTVNLIKI